MGTFHLLQAALERAEKDLEMGRSLSERGVLSRLGGGHDPFLSSALPSPERLEERVERCRRLCRRYAARIARAIAGIRDQYLKEYALYHYLYGLTHEEIAERSYFCVRTVYRHGRQAKKELERELLKLMPRVKKTDPARFTVKGTLPRKKKEYLIRPGSFGAVKRRAASIKSACFYQVSPASAG